MHAPLYKVRRSWATNALVLAGALAFLCLHPHVARAAVDGGASSDIRLLDTDLDGLIESVDVYVDNPSGDTWVVKGTPGFSVTQDDEVIDVDGVAISGSATADPVVVRITLDELDADLQQNTDGVLDAVLEISYAPDGTPGSCTDCVTDPDDELNAIASGDTDDTDTETDHAAPVITQFAYLQASNPEGNISRYSLYFSETLVAASVLKPSNLTFSSDGDFDGVSFGSSSVDMIGSDITFGFPKTSNFNTASSVNDSHDDSGDLGIELSGVFSLQDAEGNINSTTGAPVNYEVLDRAVPTVDTCTYLDMDADGKIDTFVCDFTETITEDSVLQASLIEVDEDYPFIGIALGSSVTNLVSGSVSSVTIPLGTESTVIQTGTDGESLNLVFNSTGTVLLVDSSGNTYSSTDGDDLIPHSNGYLDGASPIVYSTSPEEGTTSVNQSVDIEVTFSELLDGEAPFVYGSDWSVLRDGDELDGDALGISVAFEDDVVNERTTVVVSHDSFGRNRTIALSINAESLVDFSDNFLADGFELSYATAAGGSGGGGGSSSATSTTPVVDLTAPATGSELTAGNTSTVAWTTGGSGISTVKLEYSTDGGSTYALIADDIAKSAATYEWTVPDVSSQEVIVKITAQDSGKGYLSTDTSGLLVVAVTEDEADMWDDVSDTDLTETDKYGRRWARGSGVMGASPFDGSQEEISLLESGWFVRSENYDSVYYVDSGLERRVFWDAESFFTWADSWDQVVWVTDATLATIAMGQPMLPKSGVVLVKVMSDATVYASESDGSGSVLLREIPSETLAVELYGKDWADYVIDVEPTMLAHYASGDVLTLADEPDLSIMRTRMHLAELGE